MKAIRKRVLLAAAIAVCCALPALGSAAYRTVSAAADYVITTGGVKIALNEWADVSQQPHVPFADAAGVVPGSAVPKYVEVENTGASAAYVRVRVQKDVRLPEGTAGDAAAVTLDINTQDWTARDGYYYYNKPLQPGERTPYLFTEVRFAAEMDARYGGAQVEVRVQAEATQAANNGQSALEAAGWPAAEQGE